MEKKEEIVAIKHADINGILKEVGLPIEVWRDIKDYGGLYQASNLGNIKEEEEDDKTEEAMELLKSKGFKIIKDNK